MKRIFSAIVIAVAVIFFQFNSFAWYDVGHMIIAAEAFRQMSPELKAQAFEVLKAHPDYQEWAKAYHPNPDIDLATYVFLRSSTWPDEVRGTGGPYDHGSWHFIDYPLRPPSFAFERDASPTNDVLFGVAQCEKTLSDTNADSALRAAYLSYLIHLVGDLHQPLHCESYYGGTYTNGDRGGNDFYVNPGQGGVRLHSIWDGLPGAAASPAVEWRNAYKIDVDYPRAALPELEKHTTPVEWSLESRKLAIEYGYLDGRLKGGTSVETAPPLPDDYIRNAKEVAERRVALAGYRLADEIQEYLKLGMTVPLLPPNTNTVAEVVPKEISAEEAANYYDESMVVTGRVVDVSIRRNIVLLNFDQPYPNTPFSAVVFDDNFSKFDDFQKYKNHDVEVTGTITQFHQKPEMVLESSRQIKITDTNH